MGSWKGGEGGVLQDNLVSSTELVKEMTTLKNF